MTDLKSSGVPLAIDEFSKVYCTRCIQSECSRSSKNDHLVNRALNWKRDLFDNPPRALESDPTYDEFRSKRFISNTQENERRPVFQVGSFTPKETQIEFTEEFSLPTEELNIIEVVKEEPKLVIPVNKNPFKISTVQSPDSAPSTEEKVKESNVKPGGTFVFGSD